MWPETQLTVGVPLALLLKSTLNYKTETSTELLTRPPVVQNSLETISLGFHVL